MFTQVFAVDDGSGVNFTQSQPARDGAAHTGRNSSTEPYPRSA